MTGAASDIGGALAKRSVGIPLLGDDAGPLSGAVLAASYLVATG
jgi:hypothetical protein